MRAFCLSLLSVSLAFGALAQDEKKEEGPVKKKEVGSTPNVSAFEDKIYFGGQPKPEDIKAFADLGVKTVINLRTAPEMEALGFDEKAAVEAAGMKYIHAPMGREEPTEEFIEKTLKSLKESSGEKVLLHCGSSNRVGYVWSLFAAKERGLDEEKAIAEGKAAGMTSPQLQDWARKHIEGGIDE